MSKVMIRASRARHLVAALILCASSSAAAGAWAAEGAPTPHATLSKWPVDPQHPEQGIPSEKDRNENPLEFGYWLQDVALQAEHAGKSGDHATAARLYEVLGKAVPERAIGFVKACDEYEAEGDIEAAVNACGEALLRDGTRVSDYAHFVHLMLAKPGPLAEKDVGALAQVLVHMREDEAGRASVDELECEVGARTSNVAQLQECTTALAARAPNDVRTLSYEWALAVAQGKFGAARALAGRARAAGMAASSIAQMDTVTVAGESHRRWHVVFTVATLALLAAAALVGWNAVIRRRIATT